MLKIFFLIKIYYFNKYQRKNNFKKQLVLHFQIIPYESAFMWTKKE